MAITYRVPTPGEADAFFAPIWRGFGDPEPGDDERADEVLQWEPERSIGALDGDDWVGGTGTFTMDLTLPGGATVAAGGVTMVGVAATHRRRGILRELMARQLDHIHDRDEPVAILTASESSIYGRFGFGVATEGARLRIDPRDGTLRPEAAAVVDRRREGGRLRQISIDEARRVLPEAYERIRAGRAGAVGRSSAWWETHLFLDRPAKRDGGGSLGTLVHLDDAGRVEGWALHRTLSSWPERVFASTLRVEDLLAVDDEVHLSLWRALLDHDLISAVEVRHAPLDDPLRWALRDPRRLGSHDLSDWLFLRLLDVPRALTGRRWGGAGGLVIEVDDPFRPTAGGRFSIEAGEDGRGAIRRTDAEPDLVMGTETLSCLTLGTVTPRALARVGRVEVRTSGVLARADVLFGTERLPHCMTMF